VVLAARRMGAPPGVWRWTLGAAGLVLVASQALPAGHPLRADLAGAVVALAWLVVAAVPLTLYALWVRGLRRRARPDAPSRPVGLVQFAADAALAADTAGALEAEARAAGAFQGTLSLGWRAPDGALAGQLRLRQTGRTAEIEALWVALPHRGQGIGTRLVAAAEAEARARGLERLAVAPGSWQGPGLFRRAGFTVVAERPLGSGLGRVWMEKEL
jgi:ribosomal protein S18 acetylase RimI-like enzyme